MLLVSSGATEIGRLDYIMRNGHEASGDLEDVKTDYSAQGQAILMTNYRRFISPEYSAKAAARRAQPLQRQRKARSYIKVFAASTGTECHTDN